MNRRTKAWAFMERGFLTLAVVALAVLLLQPICEAHVADAVDPTTCCASMVDALPAAPDPAVLPTSQPSPAVAIAQAPTLPPVAVRILTVAPPGHPPACLSYHARSARNLS